MVKNSNMDELIDRISVSFPVSLDSIPLIRNFTAEVLHLNGGSDKFRYRSEMVVDELCTNAIKYGSTVNFPRITLSFLISLTMVRFSIENANGSSDNIAKLQERIGCLQNNSDIESDNNLGLKLVSILSDALLVDFNDDGTTIVHSVRSWE